MQVLILLSRSIHRAAPLRPQCLLMILFELELTQIGRGTEAPDGVGFLRRCKDNWRFYPEKALCLYALSRADQISTRIISRMSKTVERG